VIEKVKILYGVNIQTDHVSEHRRPGIVGVEKDNKTALLIDIAMPRDTRVDEKEQKKVDSGTGTRTQETLERNINPVVFGVLGTIPKSLENPEEIWDNSERRVTL